MSDYKVPLFETERLILRAHEVSDADSYQNHFSNYNVIRNMAKNVPWPYPTDGAFSYLNCHLLPEQGKTRWDWAITLKNNPKEVIGSIGIWNDSLPGNRGFWLSENHWGKGLMTEATSPIINFAFEVLNFKILILTNASGNKQSRRVKEKSGAVLVSLSEVNYIDETLSESEIWVLTKKAWASSKKSA